MKKQLLAIASGLSLALTLAACGGGHDEHSGKNKGKPTARVSIPANVKSADEATTIGGSIKAVTDPRQKPSVAPAPAR